MWELYSSYIEVTKMSERSGTLADDPGNNPVGDSLKGRRPTSHERMSGRPWDASYTDGPAPWDIGRPQPTIARLASAGGFAGAILDAGCGTGEHTLLVASLGLPGLGPVLGVDVAETALAIARKKASDRGMGVEFTAADALHLERLGRRFETVLDCGLFHTFDRDERPGYVASLASVTEHGGILYVLCFSDQGPDTGPHPISEEELTAAFNLGTGWNVAAIEADRIHTRFHGDNGAPALLATIKRIWGQADLRPASAYFRSRSNPRSVWGMTTATPCWRLLIESEAALPLMRAVFSFGTQP